MSKLARKSIGWSEPYWSHHNKDKTIKGTWLFSFGSMTRIQVVAAITFIIFELLFIVVFPSSSIMFMFLAKLFISTILGVSGIALLTLVAYRFGLPLVAWVVPPFIRITDSNIKIEDMVSKPLRLKMQDISSILWHEQQDGRKSVTFVWGCGERTVGVPNRVTYEQLRVVCGGKLQYLNLNSDDGGG